MTKYLIPLLSLFLAVSLFGQNAKVARASAYAAEAKKEFLLDDQKTAKIQELWIARSDAFAEVSQKLKSGSITAEEKKAADSKISQRYTKEISETLGCTAAEFRKFNTATMKKAP